jgi:hypothetical protein
MKAMLGNEYVIPYMKESKNAEAFPLWHTWFTGLYGKRVTNVYLWYPGGKLDDAIGKLEYRPRPQ